MVNLIFRTHYATTDHGCLALVGSLSEFGTWNPEKGIRANQHPEGTWEAKVSLSAGQDLEFKWVILYGDNYVRWEDRPNRYIKTPVEDTAYTSTWNEELEITELKSIPVVSALRNRKRDLQPVTQLSELESQTEAVNRRVTGGSLQQINDNLSKELQSVRRMSPLLQDLTEKHTMKAKKYSVYNRRICPLIAKCLALVMVISLWCLLEL
ncbi:hypothetical protein SNE40_019547 [Patella caerulea]|uniref:CBM20 domain-containing protein n=1 Tax=Patella caerulea TaxID=87958 RepID=A0AAN8J783_PATCE